MKVTYKDLLELKMILLLTLFVNAFFLRGEELSTKRCSECQKKVTCFIRLTVRERGKPRFQERSKRGETLATRIIQG